MVINAKPADQNTESQKKERNQYLNTIRKTSRPRKKKKPELRQAEHFIIPPHFEVSITICKV